MVIILRGITSFSKTTLLRERRSSCYQVRFYANNFFLGNCQKCPVPLKRKDGPPSEVIQNSSWLSSPSRRLFCVMTKTGTAWECPNYWGYCLDMNKTP